MIRLLLPFMLTIFLLLQMTHLGYGRSIIRHNIELVSDGSDSDVIIQNLRETTVTCEPLYGFLPCTTKIWGHLFLIVIYQYLLYEGGKHVSNAPKKFEEIHGHGSILGGSLFQILGTFPQLVLVLASGFLASTETAEQQVAMGMQLLAGSTVMMLTLVWGACVFFGSYNLPNGGNTLSSWLNTGSIYAPGFGVSAELKTRWIARIMLISMIPIIILQLAKMINSSTWTRAIILVALIVTACLLIVHCIYQVTEPWIVKRRFKHLLDKYVEKMSKRLATPDGKPKEKLIKWIFRKVDTDHDGVLTIDELRSYLTEQKFGEYDVLMGINDYVDNVMREIDSKPDGKVELNEFVNAISGWIEKAKNAKLVQQSDSDKTENSMSSKRKLVEDLKAVLEFLLGLVILALLSPPYLQTIWKFSVAANIDQFFIPYVVIPLVLNVTTAYYCINTVRQKKACDNSITLSKIYQSVCMKNLVGLTTFLALVYGRNLSGDVSAEVLVVLIICTTMGLVASFCKELRFWKGLIAIVLYPVSLLLLHVFTNVLGWS